jgi:parallel beta-helix repeat protein
MKTQIYVLVALAACSGLLLPVFSAGLLESSVTIYSSGIVQQTSTGTYSYIISVSGSNYQMTDGTTGQIDYQSTNATQVVNDAIGNLTQSGGSILFSGGTYNLNGSITVKNKDNITLAFENGAALFVTNGMNTPAMFINLADNCIISGATINGNAANQIITGPMVKDPDGILIAGSSNVKIDNALIYNCRVYGVNIIAGSGLDAINCGVINSKLLNCGWNGINLGGSNSAMELSLYAINNEVTGSSDVGITTYGIGNIIQSNYIHDMNGTTGSVPGSDAPWGIGIEGGSNDIITQNTLQDCASGIVMGSWGGGWSNCTISNNFITNSGTYTPISGAQGILLQSGSRYNSITDNYVAGMYCNSSVWLGGEGIILQNSTFNFVSGNTISKCGDIGIYLDSTSNNNIVSLNTVSDTQVGNYWETSHAGTGIDIVGSSNSASQNQIFDDRSGVNRTQTYGIYLESGASNNSLIGNNIYNNINAQILDTNVPENTMIANTGYNPVGYIANPISGNTAYLVDSGSSSTWISGRVYTNTGSPKVLNISAGTVSVVAQNGVTLFTATGCTVTLQPGDTFSVTFSTTPTINVIGQ